VPRSRPLPSLVALGLALGLALGGGVNAGCATKKADGKRATQGENSFGQMTRYTRKAVRRSPEGFILIPSKRAERAFDRVRLNELAQDLRAPAAVCFINRTIETAHLGEQGGEAAYVDVPEGQAKIRVRIAPTGEVLRTDVLETGFEDEEMEACLMEVLKDAPWPENRSGNAHWIDVIYWVSLGFQGEDQTPAAKENLRRQTALVAVKGKGCLEGRVKPGTYPVRGLSLLDREGRTLVNRLEPSDLPQEVADCLAYTLRELRMQRAGDAFVRPFTTDVEFTVAKDGAVSFADERWLTLLLLEERAERDAKRAELLGDDPNAVAPPTVEGEVAAGLVDLGPEPPEDREDAPTDALADDEGSGDDAVKSDVGEKKSDPGTKTNNPGTKTNDPGTKKADPGKGGLKLNLGARPSG
jgi:hypothetical protein